MSTVDDSEADLLPTATPGYKPSGSSRPDELAKLDAQDESLNRWKASLGIVPGASAANTGPKLTVLSLELVSDTLPPGKRVYFDLADPSQDIETLTKKNPVIIKEGIDYSVKITFRVNHSIVSGVRYIQAVKTAGIKGEAILEWDGAQLIAVTVDKMEKMIGSYGPHAEGKPYEKVFESEESPSGLAARTVGYSVQSRVVDDDGEIYADWKWHFKLAKEWKCQEMLSYIAKYTQCLGYTQTVTMGFNLVNPQNNIEDTNNLDKPIGTLLLFYPCAWSITMASYATQASITIPLTYISLFGLGAFVMRGAGCTINDMWDKNLDKSVDRTKDRPLARGDITQKQALVFLGAQLTAGLGVLLQLNWYSIFLGASSLSLVTIYPLMKRITDWPQAVLGLAFNWGALLGWSAVAGTVEWAVALPMYAGGVCWTLVYDSIYAHQDKKDDIQVGIRSTALLFGENSRAIMAGLSVSTISLVSLAGFLNGQNLPFYCGVGLAAVQLARVLRRTDFSSRSNTQMTYSKNYNN
ncbi:hypothetical protein NP233_g1287 [Leucocoprinus birnbaumii]|uniref:4-hydroxybenzoate polyprenyltransferase, mitochondrial n=1 Tax=Leucocoprinus birnbaumii TaxID=56174 RepID=A0AAD5W0L3_9AGAR|nr:hypothetical protein NP233_g1287 [Leucocoprinus birnbaumii]